MTVAAPAAATLILLLLLSLLSVRTLSLKLDQLRTPAVVIDKKVASRNALAMLGRAKKLGCELRPHVKTHKTVQGALMQTGNRRSKITVSTLAEAEFFSERGFDDIVYAVPLDSSKIERAAEVSASIERFHVVVDNMQQLVSLLSYGRPSPGKRWSIVIMCDCGYGRDGVDVKSEEAVEIARAISQSDCADLCMLYTHAGHSYDVGRGDVSGIIKVSEQVRACVFVACCAFFLCVCVCACVLACPCARFRAPLLALPARRFDVSPRSTNSPLLRPTTHKRKEILWWLSQTSWTS